MVEKANLTTNDKERMKAILALENAIEFMSSEESDGGDREQTTRPPPRHVKPLQWERTKLKSIKAVLDATYQARMKKNCSLSLKSSWAKCFKQASAKNSPCWAGRQPQS